MTTQYGGLRNAVEELTENLWATISENTGIAPWHWRGTEYADGLEDGLDRAIEALRSILAAHPQPVSEPQDSDCASCYSRIDCGKPHGGAA